MAGNKIGTALALLAFAGLLLAHGGREWPVPQEARERKNPVAPGAATLKEAKGLFEKECAACHGSKGDGKGPGAGALREKPADLTDSPMMKEMTDGEIFYKISEGRMPMPAFKARLSEEQRWKLVNYLRTLAKEKPGAAAQKPAHKH